MPKVHKEIILDHLRARKRIIEFGYVFYVHRKWIAAKGIDFEDVIDVEFAAVKSRNCTQLLLYSEKRYFLYTTLVRSMLFIIILFFFFF